MSADNPVAVGVQLLHQETQTGFPDVFGFFSVRNPVVQKPAWILQSNFVGSTKGAI